MLLLLTNIKIWVFTFVPLCQCDANKKVHYTKVIYKIDFLKVINNSYALLKFFFKVSFIRHITKIWFFYQTTLLRKFDIFFTTSEFSLLGEWGTPPTRQKLANPPPARKNPPSRLPSPKVYFLPLNNFRVIT